MCACRIENESNIYILTQFTFYQFTLSQIIYKLQMYNNITYPTVVIVMKAHQIPSHEPAKKDGGNSLGFRFWS